MILTTVSALLGNYPSILIYGQSVVQWSLAAPKHSIGYIHIKWWNKCSKNIDVLSPYAISVLQYVTYQ